MKGAWRVASDIGGTFTDIAHIRDDGTLITTKAPSTPPDFGKGVVAGLSRLARDAGLALDAVTEMVHGCTVATNVILEGKGARTALLTTAGFRDVLELRRIRVPRLYEPLFVKPPPLSPRNLRFEARERLSAEGAVVTPLDEDDVAKAAEAMLAAGVEAAAICFLHSYINPDHERRAGEILRSIAPDLFVSLSVDVLPRIREYERTSTTVVNAYVGPPVRQYLQGMEADLAAAGCPAPITIMQSSGGVVDAEAVKEKPAQIVECGPAAGVVGAAALARMLGYENAITFDMGGTTAKASMIEGGSIFFADEYEVGSSMSSQGVIAGGGGYALKLPVIDISEVGAGGGSLIRLDKAGAIKVGPESAGAVPGPACYGQGGDAPTVTDANVVLGYLNQSALAGGTVPIDVDLSRKAITEQVAAPLGLDAARAAYGVHQVANAAMVRAIKAVSTYRGRDPRDFVMMAFGGNGGVHGAGLAKALEIKRVIVPPAAGVFSAVGLLLARREVSVAAACSDHLGDIDADRADQVYGGLLSSAEKLLGLKAGAAETSREVEMRYVGQAFELTVDLGADSFAAASRPDLRRRFDEEHARRFGHAFGEAEKVEIMTLKLTASDPAQPPVQAISTEIPPSAAPSHREVWFGDDLGLVRTPIIARGDLGPDPRAGPLVIEEDEGATVAPPGAQVSLGPQNIIIIDLDD